MILDNLSPRLEYIEGSQTSSVINVVDAANFTATPNEVGSAVLRWEIKSEMKPGEGAGFASVAKCDRRRRTLLRFVTKHTGSWNRYAASLIS